MLCLSEQDMLAAAGPADILAAVEEALRFQETGDFVMPVRSQVDFRGDTLLLMPCFTEAVFGTKLVTVFPGNAAKNAPVVDGIMVLNDTADARPLALLNGRVLTALRTGAVGGVGVRYLTAGLGEAPLSLGLVGAGAQGFQQARLTAAARPVKRILVHDLDQTKLDGFVDRLAEAVSGVTVAKAASVEDMLAACQVVITATTSENPVLPDGADLLAGKKFVGIGSYKPAMRELPEALFRLADRVFIDTEHALEETGDLITPIEQGWLDRDRVTALGRLIISGDRVDRKATVIFKSVGMALFDVVVGRFIYERAGQKGLGQEISL